MSARHTWTCLGFLALAGFARADDPETLANQLWQQGQQAMRRCRPDEAIGCYERSLATDPTFLRNHLSLAAAYLEKKDEPQACCHLGKYVESHPDKALVRARYAELLHRLHRLPEARAQWEQFIVLAQEQGSEAAAQLIPVHSKLMEIGEESQDEYAEHLHRGIGLYLLACKRSTLPQEEEDLPAEGILCKAAAELTLAHQQRPGEARPSWYLHEVWSQLGQRQPAICRLRQAEAAAPFSYLTPAEQRRLNLATDCYRREMAMVASKK
jgi:tetratricopeptide (TPR) repeat protein